MGLIFEVKISPKAHVITEEHVNEDNVKYKFQGITGKVSLLAEINMLERRS